MNGTRRLRFIAFAVALTTFHCGPVAAAGSGDTEGAKREGVVVWYSSVDTRALAATVQRFEQLHPGIKLQALQIGSSLIPARVMTERQSGHPIVDVISGDDFSLSQLSATGILQPYRPKEADKFTKGAVDPAGFWTALYSDTTVIAWNPEKLKADGLKPPTSLADFAKPEWQGKIGIDSSAYNWYSGTLKTVPNAEDLLKRIAANHPFLTTGHTVTITQLQAGEFDATPTAYGYMAESQRRAGGAVNFINSKPVLVGIVPVAIVQTAPHPNAARVLVDWLLSKDGQQFFVDNSGRTSMRTDVRNDTRVFDTKQPFYLMTSPDRSQYNDTVTKFKQLLGITT